MLAIGKIQAGKIQVHIPSSVSDITQLLTKAAASATTSDTLFITLAKGNYSMRGSVMFRTNVVLKGKSPEATAITLWDQQGNRSDAFLKFDGKKQSPIAVSISNLTIKLQEHTGILWSRERQKFLVKVNHANRLSIDRIKSYCDNAFCTNLDMRVCQNISITNCEFVNYNNCKVGGILWFRGNTQNVLVRGNKLRKYGNDEVIALWEVGDNAHAYPPQNTTSFKKDILITENSFYYGRPDDERYEDVTLNVMVNLYADFQKEFNVKTTFDNIRFTNNNFSIEAPVNCIFGVTIDPNTRHQGIVFSGNNIRNRSESSATGLDHIDIHLTDHSPQPATITVQNNTTKTDAEIVNSNNSCGYTHLAIDGANVDFTRNRIDCAATTSSITRNGRNGVMLMWIQSNGAQVTMSDNVCRGLYMLCQASFGKGISNLTLNAHNNFFAGDTRIYCNNLATANLSFTNNTFESDSYEFFLQEFAEQGQLVFNHNKVTTTKPGGALMAHYNKNFTPTFERLEVMGNDIAGVSEKKLLKNFELVKKRSVMGNRLQP